MAAYDDVLNDLRKLRHMKANRPIDFTNSPDLVWHTGRGNIDVTTRFLTALYELDDVEIRAALASLGFDAHSGNIEERMNAFAAQYKDETTRTVRRWADEGFKKIAHIVIEWSEEEGNDSAVVEILLEEQRPSELAVQLLGWGMPSMKMLPPSVSINFEKFDLTLDDLSSHPSRGELLFSSSFSVSKPDDHTSHSGLEIHWAGNAQVRYEIQVHPTVQGVVCIAMVTKKGCEITLVNERDYSKGRSARLSDRCYYRITNDEPSARTKARNASKEV